MSLELDAQRYNTLKLIMFASPERMEEIEALTADFKHDPKDTPETLDAALDKLHERLSACIA